MKDAFYFTLKALSVLKVFKICPDFFDNVGKRLHKKGKVNFKIYDLTDWEKISTIHICTIWLLCRM